MMKRDTKAWLLLVACWLIVVILPTAAICVHFHIHSVAVIAVALPFILIGERVYRVWLKKAGAWGPAPGAEDGK